MLSEFLEFNDFLKKYKQLVGFVVFFIAATGKKALRFGAISASTYQ